MFIKSVAVFCNISNVSATSVLITIFVKHESNVSSKTECPKTVSI